MGNQTTTMQQSKNINTTTITTKMNPTQINDLAKKLEAASFAYHNGQTLIMTDEEFDVGIDTLRAAAPDHPFLAKVGAPVAAGDEVSLPIPLPSLNKIKPDGSLEKWLKKYPATSYHISAKLDGCSALWLPTSGKLYTRGDGMLGRDISAFAPHFQGLIRPPAGPISYAIRGELIMRTDSPAIPTGKMARNIVAGVLNRKAYEADPVVFAELRFVAYELIRPHTLTPEDSYKTLRTLGFETARAAKVSAADMNPAKLSELFSASEAKSPYQMDGIVVAPNTVRAESWAPTVRKGAAVNPDDRVAWKTRVTASSARTTVRSIEWNVSAHGIIIPRVLFDSVTLSGANISAATGLHGRWIFDNSVGPGAEIEVRRAGDVIPQIIAVHTPGVAGPAMPALYAWDGDADTAVHIKPADGEAADEAAVVQITRALSELGAENVGPGLVAKLYAAGYKTVGQIYAASAADFAANVDGCKGKMAQKIWDGLRIKQSAWTELNFLVASCVMPRGVGHSKMQPLLEIEPNVAAWNGAVFKAQHIAGLSDKTIDSILACIPDYLSWRSANISAPVTTAPVKKAVVAAPSGIIAVFTGFRDKALEAAMAAAGHEVAGAVTKKTTHVVHADGADTTTVKITKARDMGIKIMSGSEFKAMLGF